MAELTQARALELFNYDAATGSLRWKRRDEAEFATPRAASCWNSRQAGAEAGYMGPKNYWRVKIGQDLLLKHRVIWLIVHGEWPTVIDHINGDPSDNRLCNLRNVTVSENSKNLRLNKLNRSGQSGVYHDKGTGFWRAYIKVLGEAFFIGSFETKADAVVARQAFQRFLGFHPLHGTAKERRAA